MAIRVSPLTTQPRLMANTRLPLPQPTRRQNPYSWFSDFLPGKLRKVAQAICLSAALGFAAPAVLASGGDGFYENPYMPEHYVAAPDLPGFAAGNLGVVPNTYWRVYLWLTWRAANGDPITPQELAKLDISGWTVPQLRGFGEVRDESRNGITAWRQARMAAGATPDVTLNVENMVNDFVSFVNCSPDAFRQATATLNDRRQRDQGAWTKAWLAGQDAVFANCTDPRDWNNRRGPQILQSPPALPANPPLWLQHDHAYQTAAALFYAGQYDQARQAFQTIARTSGSPWQPLGAYLATRALIRKASLQAPITTATPQDPGRPPAPSYDLDLLRQAREELLAQSKTYAPARALIGWVDARLNPQQQLDKLAEALGKGRLDEQAGQQLADFIYLMDHVQRTDMMAAKSPLAAWLGAMQAAYEDDVWNEQNQPLEQRRITALDVARKHWRGNGQLIWLLPLASNAKTGELTAEEIKAITEAPATSPIAQSLHYHAARLALLAGQAASADQIISATLKRHGATMSAATHNRWQALKMVSAPSIEEFFAATRRRIVITDTGTPIPDEGKQGAAGLLDNDFERHLFRDLPLKELVALAARPEITSDLKARLAETIWTRAVILDDYATADLFTDELARNRNTTRHLYERFKTAPDADAKRLAATLILVNTPELTPNTYDDKGDPNAWGCPQSNYGIRADPLNRVSLSWLKPEARQQAAAEQKRLQALPLRTAYLAPNLLAWAKTKPDDPEAPKALHFFVSATRLECQSLPEPGPGSKKPTHSRDAFQLLHKHYPKSSWTAKTKYYF